MENTTSMPSVFWRIFLGRKLQINGVGRVIFGQEMFNPVPAKVMGGLLTFVQCLCPASLTMIVSIGSYAYWYGGHDRRTNMWACLDFWHPGLVAHVPDGYLELGSGPDCTEGRQSDALCLK